MTALKVILGVAVSLIVLLLIIGFILPSTGHVERKVVLKSPTPALFALVNDLHSWSLWDAWSKMDPNMTVTFEGPEAGAGSSRTWEGKKVGKGSMKITSSELNRSVKTQMDFGQMGQPTGGFNFNEVATGTEVTWYMDMNYGMNPLKRISGAFMDKMVGPDFEKGLASLDSVAQTVKTPSTIAPADTVATPTAH